MFKCECGKEFGSQRGLSLHKKKCDVDYTSINKDTIDKFKSDRIDYLKILVKSSNGVAKANAKKELDSLL